MKEIWKDIKNYEGKYQISNLGRVKSFVGGKERILLQNYSNKGYACIQLSKKNKIKKFQVHRLVAEAFIPNPDNLPEIDHKDENKANNNVNNLKWCTRSYNANHSKYKIQKAVYCFDLDKYFESAGNAATFTSACRTSILKACKGQISQAGGMLWCYAEDKNKKFPLR